MRPTSLLIFVALPAAVVFVAGGQLSAQQQPAAPAVSEALRNERREDPRPAPGRREGEGPFPKLIIRGATLIDGTGGPPRGPVDIVIEGNRITEVAGVGYPGVPIDSVKRPKGPAREINGTGMYVMPGLVDLHVHQGTQQKAPESEYYNKLWLAHGITTVRGVPFASFDYSIKEKARSAKNEIAAPRYVVYQRPGTGWDKGPVKTPEDARAWVAARMKVTPRTLDTMLDVVRLIRPSESDALLGPPRPRLMATAARIQAVLLDSGVLTKSVSLEPIFRWPVRVNQSACRG